MTYLELKRKLSELTDDQLNQTIRIIVEDIDIDIPDLIICEEDYINEFDGIKPVSVYMDNMGWTEEDLEGARRIAVRGDVLFIGYRV